MKMNISGKYVKSLRIQKGWTQEHLATLAGCNVRTIQRVEKDGLCGIETKTALASVFEVQLNQLDGEAKTRSSDSVISQGLLFYSKIQKGQIVINIIADVDAFRFTHDDPKTREDAKFISYINGSIRDYADAHEFYVEAGTQAEMAFDLNDMLIEIEENGYILFGLRTKTGIKSSFRGKESQIPASIANFHLAYAKCNAAALDPTTDRVVCYAD